MDVVLAPAIARDVDAVLHPGGGEGARVRARVPTLVDRAALGFEAGAGPALAHGDARRELRGAGAGGERGAGDARGDGERDAAGDTAGPGVARRRGVGGGAGEKKRRDRARAPNRTRTPDATDLHAPMVRRMSPRFQRSAFDTRFVWWNLMNVSSPDRFEEEERRRITQLLSKMNGS